MAEVDTSSYPRPGQPQNQLDQILKVGQVADTLGGIEVGKGMQAAIQPDGSVDRNALAQILKGSVAGSMQAPKAFSAIEALRNAGHAADEQAVRSQMAQVQYVASQMSPFYKKKGGVTQEDLIKIAGPTIANGTKLGVKGVIPSVAEALQKTHGMNDIQRGQWLDQHYEQGLATGRQFEAELPRTKTYDDQGNLIEADAGTQKNPKTFTIKKQVAPGQPTIDDRQTLPNGQPNPNYGQPSVLGPGGSGGPNITDTGIAGRPPVRQFTEGSRVVSREPPVDAATGRPIQSREATRANAPIPTGLPPGETERLKASQDAYTAASRASADYQTRINPLKSAIPLLEKVTTGPTTEIMNHVQAAAEALGFKIPTSEDVSSYAKAKKYLNQNATSIAPAGTNVPGVMAAFESNPNMQQPSDAVRDLTKVMLTLSRMKQAEILAFEKTNLPKNRFTEWAAEWGPQQDARAYGADLMSPEQRTKLEKSIKAGSVQAKRFKNSFETAKEHELLGDVEGH